MKHHTLLPGFALSSAIRAPTVENTSFARWMIVLALAVQAATALAKDIVVPRDFQTIQAAVDAGAQGDVIKILPGTYREQLVIEKNLELRGTGAVMPVVLSPSSLAPLGTRVTGEPLAAVVRIGRGAHVHWSRLAVAGPLPCGLVSGIVAIQGAHLEISEGRISNMVPNAAQCPGLISVRALRIGLPPSFIVEGRNGANASAEVTNTTIDRFQHVGVDLVAPYDLPASTLTFTRNVVHGGAPSIPDAPIGINVAFNSSADIRNNTIVGIDCTASNCGPDPISGFQSIGVFVDPDGQGSIISDNYISGVDAGIFLFKAPNCCQITHNTIQNRRFGIIIRNGDAQTRENLILGGDTGIVVVADQANTVGTLIGDHIVDTTVAPVREISCCGFIAKAMVWP